MSILRQSSQGGWPSRWTFVAAATGATVGLGNLWKFSYLAGEHGGAAFVLVYLLCVVLVAVPIMIAEVILGSRGRANPVSTMQALSLEADVSRWWQGLAWVGLLAALLILSYYSVIAGWGMFYVPKILDGQFLAGSAQLAGDHFVKLLADPTEMMLWQGGGLAIVTSIVAVGVPRGLAYSARFLIPLLFLMLVVLVLYSAKVGDLSRALEFLFVYDPAALTTDSLLVALGQAFFTLSIGVGVLLAYGAYVPDKRSISRMVCWVALLDTLVALLAGLVIFPLVFALNIEPSMGPGLMFVAMPYAFGNMEFGNYFGSLFFAMVSMTAISSGVALMEPSTAWLGEHFHLRRPLAALCVGLLVWLLGLMTVFSFNLWSEFRLGGMSLFALIDFISSNILLPLGGLLVAFFVGWIMRPEVLRDELYVESRKIFTLWRWVLRYIALPAVLVIFVVTLYESLQAL